MPRNADHKAEIRSIMKRDGVSYTTALRSIGEPALRESNPFGFASGSELEHGSHLSTWLPEVRRDIYSISELFRTPEAPQRELLAAAHYAAVEALLTTHPSARLDTEDPLPTSERWRRVDWKVRQGGPLLHAVRFPLADGGEIEIDVWTSTGTGRVSITGESYGLDGEWVDPPQSFHQIQEIAGNALQSEMSSDAGTSDAAIALRSRNGRSRHEDHFWDYIAARWAQDRGLRRTKWACLCALSSSSGRVSPQHRRGNAALDCNVMSAHPFDHPRVFTAAAATGPRRPAVVTAHPYGQVQTALLGGLAKKYGLAMRVAVEADRGYSPGTTPVILWNPRVIDLP